MKKANTSKNNAAKRTSTVRTQLKGSRIRTNDKPFWVYPYPYVFNEICFSNEGGQECVSTRLGYYLSSKHISVKTFTSYLNTWGVRYKFKTAPMTIYSYLAGKYSPKIDRLVLIAKAMGVTPAWLAGYGPRSQFDHLFNGVPAPVIDEGDHIDDDPFFSNKANNMVVFKTNNA